MPTAIKEIEKLEEFALQETNNKLKKIESWDLSFWSEKLRQHLFNLNQEITFFIVAF